ncbi:hypothetical protein [Azohydromonas sediminis]|uniref:hypothetical protein n=1 Tax=Azohydromonas sediminis TaxID=2259674 RepID=UPI0013C2FE8F|nr:hypothetical protein [Azohydromonas sediminis]
MAAESDGPPPAPPRRSPGRRSALVDAAMGALAALPVLAVLLDHGDFFLLVAALLPVAVMFVCSFDPPDIAEMAARLRDARRPPLKPPRG